MGYFHDGDGGGGYREYRIIYIWLRVKAVSERAAPSVSLSCVEEENE